MTEKRVFTYAGERMDVHWDGRLCIHIGECGHAEGDLFVAGRNPWCQPDRVDDANVRDVVMRCPSGALSWTDKASGRQEQAAADNTVMVAYNGPLFVRGDLAIEGAADDMPGVRFRAALCRCGRSNNKPFCDNSHLEAGFEDYGAVGEAGTGSDGTGGTLTIKPVANGPLLLEGNFTIIAASGRRAWQGDKAALCRCGHSNNKPFCDGSHKKAGFTTE